MDDGREILISIELLEQVGVRGADLKARIASARQLAVQAIMGVQDRVIRSLGGARLRGLPNLVPELNRQPSFFAARVRGGYDEPLPAAHFPDAGREVVCISDEACLISARRAWNPIGRKVFISHRWVTSDDIRVEDVQDYSRAMATALARHVQECERLSERFGRLVDLAKRLQSVVSDVGGEAPSKSC